MGFRAISVGSRIYRWSFRTGAKHSTLVLYGSVSSGQPLSVVLLDWRDPWFCITGFTVDPNNDVILNTCARNEPAIMTPKFVRSSILHSLANGWLPLKPKPRLFCVYREGNFSELSPTLGTLTRDLADPGNTGQTDASVLRARRIV